MFSTAPGTRQGLGKVAHWHYYYFRVARGDRAHVKLAAALADAEPGEAEESFLMMLVTMSTIKELKTSVTYTTNHLHGKCSRHLVKATCYATLEQGEGTLGLCNTRPQKRWVVYLPRYLSQQCTGQNSYGHIKFLRVEL